MKLCTRCSTLKPLSQYFKKYNKHKAQCKSCEIAYKIRWRASNKERIASVNSEWRAANSQRQTAQKVAYYHIPQNKLRRKQCARARQSKYQIAVDFGAPTDELIYQHYGTVCYISGVHLTTATRSIDHVIPLSKGGDWSLTNRRPMHHSLNFSKCNHDLDKWLSKPTTQRLIDKIKSSVLECLRQQEGRNHVKTNLFA